MRERFDLARRNMLRGDPLDKPVLRPPWAIERNAFLDTCTGCLDCVAACPEHVIVKGAGGYPEVHFTESECTFCGNCVERCEVDALSLGTSPPWRLQPVIADTCLALNNVVCETCRDACEPRAIRFHYRIGGTPHPEVELENCNGCGACVSACPADAIELRPRTKPGEKKRA